MKKVFDSALWVDFLMLRKPERNDLVSKFYRSFTLMFSITTDMISSIDSRSKPKNFQFPALFDFKKIGLISVIGLLIN